MTNDRSEFNRIKTEVTGMLSEEPYFGPLILRLPLIEDDSVETACTNGECIRYNPAFTKKQSRKQLRGLMAHEVLHVSNGHPWRRMGREMKRWNKAVDYAINPLLIEAGFTLPDRALIDDRYKNLSGEAIYSMLPIEKDGEGGGEGEGGFGEVEDAPAPADAAPGQSEDDWKAATESAASNAQKQGKLPGFAERLVRSMRVKDCKDLMAALLEWANRVNRNDYSWQRPNNRYLAQGLYLPSLKGVSMPPIVAAVDTSGSVGRDLLEKYTGALQRILEECKPEELCVFSCDSTIHKADHYTEGDLIDGKFPGGGGTDFRPVFEAVRLGYEDDISGLIYLTDLEGSFPTSVPDYPVLWVVYDKSNNRIKAPFGETIWING